MWITCMKKKAKFKSYSIQNVMMVTCMQKRVKIKLNPERHEGHLQAEEAAYKVQLKTEHMVITCLPKKVKIKVNSIQNREITCMQKRMNFKSNSMQEAMVVTCMQMEGQAEAPHSIKSLSSTDSLVGFNEVCFAKHIHVVRCIHRSHFQSGFLN